jgi:hypothetical protein
MPALRGSASIEVGRQSLSIRIPKQELGNEQNEQVMMPVANLPKKKASRRVR